MVRMGHRYAGGTAGIGHASSVGQDFVFNRNDRLSGARYSWCCWPLTPVVVDFMTIDSDIGRRLRASGHIHDGEDLTVLYDRFLFVQSAKGYRFGIDAVLLARYAARSEVTGGRKDLSVLDVGTGCGIAAVLMASLLPHATIHGIEIQPAQVDRARRNVALNSLSCRIFVIEGDMGVYSEGSGAGVFDLVISNPPFYRAGSGRINPDGERAIARHEIRLTMAGLLNSTVRVLAPDGHAVVLYPAERLEECFAESLRHGLIAAAVVPLLPLPDATAESYLIDLVHSRPGMSHVTSLSAPMFLARHLNPVLLQPNPG